MVEYEAEMDVSSMKSGKALACVMMLAVIAGMCVWHVSYMAASQYVSPVRDSLSYCGFAVMHLDCETDPLGCGWRVVHKYSFKKPVGCFSNALNVYVSLKGVVYGMDGKYESFGDKMDDSVIQKVRAQEKLYYSGMALW